MERFRSSDANALAELLAISDSLRKNDDDDSADGSKTQHLSSSAQDDLNCRDLFQHLMHRKYRRPFLLLNFLFLLMTFSGKYAIAFYAVEIFHKASEDINEYFSAIIIGKKKRQAKRFEHSPS